MNLQENVALAPLTTLQVGGPARFFVEAHSSEAVREAVTFARARDLPLFVLGGGSNLVVSDAGWPGLVLKVRISGIEEMFEAGGRVRFEVGAGESWDSFVSRAVMQDCAGVECLSGIPGSVGGTPVQNVGAYGQEVSQTIDSVQVFDLQANQIRELCAEACGFEYRTSIFNTTERGRFIILQVAFYLAAGGAPSLHYADLQRYFADRQKSPTLAETRKAVCEIRARKGMLIQEGDPDSRSAGSFFKNPVLTEQEHRDLAERAAKKNLIVPSYPALAEHRKVSAAWLVEHAGFHRGYTLGHAGISTKHSLAIVNRDGATASEIVALKDQIQKQVEEIWGIHLQPEPVFVGAVANSQESVASRQ